MKRQTGRFAFPIGLLFGASWSLGGCTESTPNSGWVSAGTLLDARAGHSATLLDDGSVLFVGGENARGLVPSAEMRDTATNQWSLLGSLNAARKEHATFKRSDGQVIVLGGTNSAGLSTCVEVYQQDTRQFTRDESWTDGCPEQPLALLVDWSTHVNVWPNETTTAHERIVVADGKTGATGLYDPSQDTWANALSAPMTSRSGYSMTVLTREKQNSQFDIPDGGTGENLESTDDAILLVVGGGENPIAEYLDVVKCIHDSQCTWHDVDVPGVVYRTNHSATYLGNGDVLVVGGQDKDGNAVQTADIYRFNWDEYEKNVQPWTLVGTHELHAARYGHTATRLNDGTVLVVGGRDAQGNPADSVESSYKKIKYSAELSDDTEEFGFTQMPSMSTPRAEHTATWLPDGTVLVAGGINADSSYVATAERFVPEDRRIPCDTTADCPKAMICNAVNRCEQSAAPLELQGSCTIAGDRSSCNAGALAVMVGLAGAWFWRRRRTQKRAMAALSLGVVLFVPSLSRAQTPTFYLERLSIAGGSEDGTGVWRPVFGRTGLFGQLGVGYARAPLRVSSLVHDSANTEALFGSPVTLQITGYATAGLEFAQRGAIQVTLPYVIEQRGYPTDNRRVGLDQVVKMESSSLGDLRIDGRMLVAWNESHSFALAVRVAGYLPTGDEYSFTSEGHAWGNFGLAAEYNVDAFFLNANAGVTMRPQSTLADLTVGPEVTYAFGAYVPLLYDRLRVGAEIWGAIGLSSRDPEAIPIEAALSGRFTLDARKRVFLGLTAGGRLGIGYSPDMRLVARIGGALPFTDAPLVPQQPVRLAPAADTDEDGFIDVEDDCPLVKEDHKRALDGCPETDEDHDGIDTSVDKCPTVPEDKDGLADDDGCPEDDFDGDGFADIDDKCAKEPGVRNEDPEKLGCPQFIERTKTEFKLSKQIEFDFQSAMITPSSFPILNEIAKVMKANPDIKQLRIEGHTDNVGTEEFNQELSVHRAEAVKDYLVKRGKIDPARLSFAGFGRTKPIASNDTKEGQAKNRRVELHIGSEAAEEEKKP